MSRHDPGLPRVVSLGNAESCGLNQQQVARLVRTGQWSRLAPAVYCTSPPHRPDDLLRAAALHAAPSGMLTGAAALTVLGFDKTHPPARPTVLVPYESGVRTGEFVVVRRATHLPTPRTVDDMSVAPVSRAVVDHAVTLTWLDDVRALVARAVQRHRCTPDELRAELPRVARRGSGKLRQAIDEIAAGARSAPEARAGRVLTDAGFRGFEQNAALAAWGLPYIGDFLWRELLAVLEIDSVEYHFDQAGYEATLARDAELKSRGLDVLHVTPRMVITTPERFVATVRRWLLARSALLGVPMPWAA